MLSVYQEVETENEKLMALTCPDCQNVIKQRKDTFLPGAHMVICVLCGFTSADVNLVNGEERRRKAQDFQTPDDFKGKSEG
jgi:predicted RNA-binding Zn-ribbon protein involved in translation (DUF1610 family)